MRTLICLLIILLAFLTQAATAHPMDELCGPDSRIDPAICAELFALDSSDLMNKESKYQTEHLIETMRVYFRIGWDHVLPDGLDHILFIFAIILSARRFWLGIGLVTVFTLSHAVAILLASLGFVNWGGPLLEFIIALTILWAGVECIVLSKPPPWRAAMVFGFGLIHGLGLAGAIVERGLPDGHFVAAFFAFNIGIEAAQLLCALFALAVVWVVNRIRPLPIQRFGGIVIAVFGLFWSVERLMAVMAG